MSAAAFPVSTAADAKSTKPPRGVFIAVEGIDRAGKTTQCKLLVDALNAKWPDSTVYMKFPDRDTETGKVIDTYLKSSGSKNEEVMYMLFATNRFEASSKITELLTRGKNVVCDRYIGSGICYGVAKGLPLRWCLAKEMGLVEPDRSLYIQVDPVSVSKRGEFGSERNDDVKLLTKVAAEFKNGMGTSGLATQDFDGERPVKDVAAALLEWALLTIPCLRGRELYLFGQ